MSKETKPLPPVERETAAKRAENKKIKDAEKLVASKEREKKLKLAEEILNPKPTEPEPVHAIEENVPLPKKTATKARRELDIDDPAPSKVSYKEEYYRRKLELMERQQQAPAQPPPQNPAYVVAKHDIKQHVDRNVMKNLWTQYFNDTECPY